MTTQRNPPNRVQPPADLEPAGREVFTIVGDLAARSCALRGVTLIPLDALLLARVAQLVVLARQRAESGKLADAAVLGDLAQEMADQYWLTLPASLLPAIGRA